MRILAALIRLIIYVGIFASLAYLFRSSLRTTYTVMRQRVYGLAQRRQLSRSSGHVIVEDPLLVPLNRRRTFQTHITDLLEATFVQSVSRQRTFRRFVEVSVGTGLGLYLLVYFATAHFLVGIPFGVIGVLLPYGALSIYKYRLSIRNSYDIAEPITLLAQKYGRHNHKMLVALHETLNDLSNSPIRKALSRLIVRLERYTSEEELLDAIDSFNIQAGTTWAMRLSSLIFAGVQRLDVNTALNELSDQFTNVRNVLQEEKATRTDTMLLGVAPIPVFLGGLYMTYALVTHNALRLLLTNSRGRMSLLIALVAAIIAPIIALTFYKPKQDL
ncbi:hypothetical protein [Alicyclobacillus ferrooxydans]|uniref:Type II secretion system protein GspF domain-containing protein n=1 Tax=Alicyclobacillus ferrooxydans TaxID=471514 RepID=A0A0P9CI20_9BACL|nr:hypothetical protein [Alicyclobacillus ferrooxydans]KPV42688.1 hypothetical protein AN477_16280 [Alicyclobacillus ferrooxydans]